MNDNPDLQILLVRHGRTELNAAGVLRGRLDPDLDEVGRAEAAALACALSPFKPTKILSSPLRRAMQTAQTIAGSDSTGALVVDPCPDLIDRDYGAWAGHRRESVAARWGSVEAAPGVEDLSTVTNRALTVLTAQLMHSDGHTTVLVSHDAVNSALLAAIDPTLGQADDIRQRTACWNLLRYTHRHWIIDALDQKATEESFEGAGHR